MKALALILALTATTQSRPSPDTTSPGWVWVTNENRFGYGVIERGYFREVATPTSPHSPASASAGSLNYGLDSQALNASPHTFATNDPTFTPQSVGRQVPLPLDGPIPTASPPWPLIAGAVMVAVMAIMAITSRRKT